MSDRVNQGDFASGNDDVNKTWVDFRRDVYSPVSDGTHTGNPVNGWSIQTAAGLEISSSINYHWEEPLTVKYPDGTSLKIKGAQGTEQEPFRIDQPVKQPILFYNNSKGNTVIKIDGKTVELQAGMPFQPCQITSVEGYQFHPQEKPNNRLKNNRITE